MSNIEGKSAFSENKFWQKRKEHVVGDGVDGKGKTAEEINHIHAASIFPFPVFSLFQYFPFFSIFLFQCFPSRLISENLELKRVHCHCCFQYQNK